MQNSLTSTNVSPSSLVKQFCPEKGYYQESRVKSALRTEGPGTPLEKGNLPLKM